MVRKVGTGKAALACRPNRHTRSTLRLSGESSLGGGDSQCKGSEAGPCLLSWDKSKQASETTAEKTRGADCRRLYQKAKEGGN